MRAAMGINGNDGEVNGATLVADRHGKKASAYGFDGRDDFIDVGNNQISGPFTISSWVYQQGDAKSFLKRYTELTTRKLPFHRELKVTQCRLACMSGEEITVPIRPVN